jgi:hypothetical protein
LDSGILSLACALTAIVAVLVCSSASPSLCPHCHCSRFGLLFCVP